MGGEGAGDVGAGGAARSAEDDGAGHISENLGKAMKEMTMAKRMLVFVMVGVSFYCIFEGEIFHYFVTK